MDRNDDGFAGWTLTREEVGYRRDPFRRLGRVVEEVRTLAHLRYRRVELTNELLRPRWHFFCRARLQRPAARLVRDADYSLRHFPLGIRPLDAHAKVRKRYSRFGGVPMIVECAIASAITASIGAVRPRGFAKRHCSPIVRTAAAKT